jgi:hypothetical protein
MTGYSLGPQTKSMVSNLIGGGYRMDVCVII